jgi:hypothetical protein
MKQPTILFVIVCCLIGACKILNAQDSGAETQALKLEVQVLKTQLKEEKQKQEANSEFTLGNLISLEQLENGTDAERIKQLEDAFNDCPQYSFIPTPEEFRIVAAGLRHENQIVRAGSAALLQRLSTKVAADVAEQMTRKRYDQFAKFELNDEAWYKSVYFLFHRPEIRETDAYIAWNKHSIGRRCHSSYLACRKYHQLFSKSFKLASYLNTQDIPTLKFAIQHKIEQLTVPTDPMVARKLQNIADHCPEKSVCYLATKLLDLINRKQIDR